MTQQPLSAGVEKLLQDLQSQEAFRRKPAAEELGRLKIHDERVVNALKVAAASDSNKYVKSAATEALHALRLELSPEEAASTSAQAQTDMPPVSGQVTAGWTSAYAPSSHSASGYAALRGIASLCAALGWLVFVLAGLGAVGGLMTIGDSVLTGMGIIIVSVIAGVFSFIILRVIAESISVFLDIETNTRQTALILEQRLK